MTRPLLALLFLASLVGCATGSPPSAIERALYTVTTNYVTNITQLAMIDTNKVVTNIVLQTNVFATYDLHPKESVVTGIQTGGTVGTMLGFGPSGAIASILASLLGAWGLWRSNKKGKALTVFGQNVETAIETFKTMPNGATLASNFKREIKSQQVEAGVKDMATVVAEEQVNTVKAEEAATRVNKGIAVNGPP